MPALIVRASVLVSEVASIVPSKVIFAPAANAPLFVESTVTFASTIVLCSNVIMLPLDRTSALSVVLPSKLMVSMPVRLPSMLMVPLVRRISGSLKVISSTFMSPVLSVRPMEIVANPSLSRATSESERLKSPLAPPMPMPRPVVRG